MNRNELLTVNRQHRATDNSGKWPINGRFNVAERAIRQARKFRAAYGAMGAIEYNELLDELEAKIVNDPRNW